MFFLGPCGEGWLFRQVVRAGSITGLLYGAAVRGVVHPSVLGFSSYEEAGLQLLGSWGYISFRGPGFCFDCMG